MVVFLGGGDGEIGNLKMSFLNPPPLQKKGQPCVVSQVKKNILLADEIEQFGKQQLRETQWSIYKPRLFPFIDA